MLFRSTWRAAAALYLPSATAPVSLPTILANFPLPSTPTALPGSGASAPAPRPRPSAPSPLPAPPSIPGVPDDQIRNATVQTMLATFYSFHGKETTAGTTFGNQPADFAGVWDARTSAAMAGFQRWQNGRGGSLPTDGQPDQASVDALQALVTRDLAATVGQTVTIPGAPTTKRPAPATTQAGMAGAAGGGGALIAIAIGALVLGEMDKGGRHRAA